MFYLTHRDYATLILDSGTLLIAFSIIYLILQHRKKERADEGSFLVLLIMNIAMAAGDILGYLFEDKAFPGSRELSIIGMTVFYIAESVSGTETYQSCCALLPRICLVR